MPQRYQLFAVNLNLNNVFIVANFSSAKELNLEQGISLTLFKCNLM